MFRVNKKNLTNIYFVVALLLLGTSFVGCTSTSSGGSQAAIPVSSSEDDDYAPVVKKWTREAHVYSQFQKQVDTFAVLFTDEMRRAFVTRWQNLHGYKSASFDDIGDGKLGIIVSLFTPEYTYMKLDERKIWGFQLDWGAQKIAPVTIKSLSKKTQFQPYLPFVNAWSQEYLLLFDVNPTEVNIPTVVPNQVTLHMRSALVAVEFVWK